MSIENPIRIFYGHGDVIEGPNGVDLSNFPDIIVELQNPERANITDLKEWFVRMFGMDGNLYSVKVQCLYLTSVNPVNFVLKPADRTKQWRTWLNWCRRRNAMLTVLVQPCPKEVVVEASSS